MQDYVAIKRGTVLVPSGPAHDPDRLHLFILLTDPMGEWQEVLMVSISSVKEGIEYDGTCVLAPGCHEFVKRHSWVDYSTACLLSERKLAVGVTQGRIHKREMLAHPVFVRVCQGLVDSPHVRPKLKKFYLDACGI